MKRVLVFGASGRVGTQLIQRCVDAGHAVTAFTRRDRYPLRHDRLAVIAGNRKDPDHVSRAMEGQELVVIALAEQPSRSPELVALPTLLHVTAALTPRQRLITLGHRSVLQHDARALLRDVESAPSTPEARYHQLDHLGCWELLRGFSGDWLMLCPDEVRSSASMAPVQVQAQRWPAGALRHVSAGDLAQFITDEIVANKLHRVRVGIGRAQ